MASSDYVRLAAQAIADHYGFPIEMCLDIIDDDILEVGRCEMERRTPEQAAKRAMNRWVNDRPDGSLSTGLPKEE